MAAPAATSRLPPTEAEADHADDERLVNTPKAKRALEGCRHVHRYQEERQALLLHDEVSSAGIGMGDEPTTRTSRVALIALSLHSSLRISSTPTSSPLVSGTMYWRPSRMVLLMCFLWKITITP